MASPRNDQIQAAIVAKLKSMSVITDELVAAESTANEIREDNWQGDEFDYPNIRVRMISNNPHGDTAECAIASISVSIMAFSQRLSSLEADMIAGLVHQTLSGRTFSVGNIQMFLRTGNLIPAVRSDVRTWRSECLMDGTVTIQPTGTSVTSGWWLLGGLVPSDVEAAYAAAGADSYEASKINLAHPGTHDAVDGSLNGYGHPDWDTVNGWYFRRGQLSTEWDYLDTGISGTTNEWSCIVKYDAPFIITGTTSFGGFYSLFGVHYYSVGLSAGIYYSSSIAPPTGTMDGWRIIDGGERYNEGQLHLSGVKAAAPPYGYTDGQITFTGTSYGNSPWVENQQTFLIGAKNVIDDSPSNFYRGYISSIAIYNKPLTQAQVQAIGAAMP